MLGFSSFEIATILVLAPIAIFLYARGHRETRRVTPADLERLHEIERLIKLSESDPRAAERLAEELRRRDDAELMALRSRASSDKSARRELIARLERESQALRLAITASSSDSPRQDVSEEEAELSRIEAEVRRLRQTRSQA